MRFRRKRQLRCMVCNKKFRGKRTDIIIDNNVFYCRICYEVIDDWLLEQHKKRVKYMNRRLRDGKEID